MRPIRIEVRICLKESKILTNYEINVTIYVLFLINDRCFTIVFGKILHYFQVILDLGLELSLSIETKKISGNTVFIVQTNALAACFDNDIDFKIVDTIADLKPFKVVFKDAGFKDDKDRINVVERFKRLSPETKVKVI